MSFCKFCGNQRKLIKAHIIPRSFWPIQGIDGPTAILTNIRGKFPKRSPNGIYDTEILCANCDGLLGRLDQHAAERLLREEGSRLKLDGIIAPCRVYDNASSSMIKDFILSVAWRANHSEHPFFSRVQLGRYEQIILNALSGDRNAQSALDVFVAEFDVDDAPFLDPHYSKYDGVNTLLLYARRFIFYVKLDRKPLPHYFAMLALQANKPVYSIIRKWSLSKELGVLRRVTNESPRPSWFP